MARPPATTRQPHRPLELALSVALLTTLVAAGPASAQCEPDVERPVVTGAGMIRWDTRRNAPKPPREPTDPCPATETYKIECGAVVDNCDAAPSVTVSAYVAGIEKVRKRCVVFHVDQDLVCGDLVEVTAMPGCGARQPRRTKGRWMFQGFDAEVTVLATDAAGNTEFVPLGPLVSTPPNSPLPDQVCLSRPPDCTPDCKGGGGGNGRGLAHSDEETR